jgi:PAS domain S-box-containing protein
MEALGPSRPHEDVVSSASSNQREGIDPDLAGEAARDIKARFRAIFDEAITAMVVLDSEGRFVETNAAVHRMLGYSEGELRGKHFADITHPDDVTAQARLHAELLAGTRDRYQLEKRYLRKGGGWHSSRVTASLIRYDSGAPPFVLCNLEDMGGNLRVEHELYIRARQQAVVAELGRYALASTDLTAVFDEAVKLVAQTLEVDYGTIWELVPEAETLLLRAGVGWPESAVGHLAISGGQGSQAGFTLLSQGPVIMPDVRAEKRFTFVVLRDDRGIVSSMTVTIPGSDRPFGVLGAYATRRRTFRQQDTDFLQAVAHVLAAALDRHRIEERRVRESRELAARVLQAQEQERGRIALELHDGTIQGLVTLLVNLDLLEARVKAGAGEARIAVERLRAIATHTLNETRALSYALRPTVLDDLGLAAALKELSDECMQSYDIEILTKVESVSERRLPPDVESVLYRVAQEALANVCRHAQASRAEVQVSLHRHGIELLIEDNGRGYRRERAGAQDRRGGLGLQGMRERAASLGGTLSVESAPRRGTRIRLALPLPENSVIIETSADNVASPRDIGDGNTKVLIVDDHAVFRDGLRMILSEEQGVTVVGEAEDGRRAVELVEQVKPDAVVMDLAMPNLNGLDATAQIKQRFPDVKVVILTAHESREYLARIAKVGADACVLKRSAGAELVTALKAVVGGDSYISPAIAGKMLDDYRVRIDRSGGDDMLTAREREVLQLIAEGHTNREIAHELVVSVKTVEAHRAHMMKKLGVHDRTDLVKHAMRMGIVSADA